MKRSTFELGLRVVRKEIPAQLKNIKDKQTDAAYVGQERGWSYGLL